MVGIEIDKMLKTKSLLARHCTQKQNNLLPMETLIGAGTQICCSYS